MGGDKIVIYGTITSDEFLKGPQIVCPECWERFYNQELLDQHMKIDHDKKSTWGYRYWARGYQITFDGKDVGGGGYGPETKRGSSRSMKQSAEATLATCKRNHQLKPFDPAKYPNIWKWLD